MKTETDPNVLQQAVQVEQLIRKVQADPDDSRSKDYLKAIADGIHLCENTDLPDGCTCGVTAARDFMYGR